MSNHDLVVSEKRLSSPLLQALKTATGPETLAQQLTTAKNATNEETINQSAQVFAQCLLETIKLRMALTKANQGQGRRYDIREDLLEIANELARATFEKDFLDSEIEWSNDRLRVNLSVVVKTNRIDYQNVLRLGLDFTGQVF